MKTRILLVEDEENLQEVIKMNLEMEGYEVITAGSGVKAVKLFKDQRFDLIVLDIMLPEMNGLQVCEKIRLENRQVPILMLTAKDTEKDRVEGLKTGADDYLTKPFNLEEFLLRVQNLLRRSQSAEQSLTGERYIFGDNFIDFANYEARGIQGKFSLTKKEARLLKLLIDRKDEVISRQQILETVWEYDVYPSTRTIDNFILNFRKYFEKDPKNPRYFHSVRGIGYKFTGDETSHE